ncbi:MAG: translocation/assembly module TamB domain-containing protein [bacterium]|nr:translocation/assembly module TamB domain-containing protein [bacterium]
MADTPEHRTRPVNWRRLGILAVLLAAVSFSLGVWLFFTESGLNWIVGTGTRMSHGVFAVGKIQGRLGGKVLLQGVEVRTQTLYFSADLVGFQLVPAGLFRISLTFGTASVDKVIIRVEANQNTAEATSDSFSSFGYPLPLGIEIGQLSVRDLALTMPDSKAPVSIDTIEFSGRIDRKNLIIRHFGIRDPLGEITVIADMKMEGDHALNADVRWSFDPPGLPRVQGSGNLEGTLSELRINQDVTGLLEGSIRGTLSSAGGVNSWNASVLVNDLHPGGTFLDRIKGSVKGNLTGGGTFATFDFRGDLSVSGLPGLGNETLQAKINGQRDADRWELKKFDVMVTGNTASLETSGRYEIMGSGPVLVLETVWNDIRWPLKEAEPIFASPSGRIDFNLQGDTYSAQVSGTLGAKVLPPGPFLIRASGKGREITIHEAQISLEAVSVHARGSLKDKWDVNWLLEAADIGAVMPSAGGSLEISGTVSGEAASPSLYAQLTGWDLFSNGVTLQSLTGTVLTTLNQGTETELDLSLTGLKVEGFHMDRVGLTGKGNFLSHSIRTSVQSSDLSIEALIDGGIDDGTWEGTGVVKGLDGILSMTGRLAWKDTLVWNGSLNATELNTALLWNGSPDDLELEAVFSGSYDEGLLKTDVFLSNLQGHYRSMPFEGEAGLGIRGESIELRGVDLTWGSAHLGASGVLEKSWNASWDLEIGDFASFVEGSRGKVISRGKISGPRGIPDLEISLDGEDLFFGKIGTSDVTATASIRIDELYPFNLMIHVAPVATGSFTTDEIKITGSGNRTDHELHMITQNPDGSPISVDINGSITPNTWEGSLLTNLLEGPLEADGKFQWGEKMSWHAAIRGDQLDPGKVLQQFHGSLTTGITLDGFLAGDKLQSDLNIVKLSGTFLGQEVLGSARILLDSGETKVRVPNLQVGTSTLKATLETGDALNGTWTLDVPNLSHFMSILRGSLRSTGALGGTPSHPSIMASLIGTTLGGGNWSAETVSFDTQISDIQRIPGSITGRATGILFGGSWLDQAALSATGTAGEHDLTVSLDYPGGKASVLVEGAMVGDTWNGVLVSTYLDHPLRGRWSLENKAELVISTTEGNIHPFCVISDGSRLCAEALWKEGEGKGSLQIHRLPLSLLTAGTVSALKIEGFSDGIIKGGRSEGRWWGSARLSTLAGSILYQNGSGKWVSFNLRETDLSTTFDSTGLQGSFQAQLGPEGSQDHVLGTLSLPGILFPRPEGSSYQDQPVQGRFVAQLAEMGFIQALAPDVDGPAGLLTATLDIKGTLGTPVTEGFVNLQDGSAGVPLLGLSLKPVEGRLTAGKPEGFTLDATAGSGRGRLHIQGSVRNPLTKSRAMELRFKGEEVTAARTPVISLVISPDLILTAEDNLFTLKGSVNVPEASFNPVEISVTQRPSPDVVVIAPGSDTTPKPPLKVRGDVRLNLGDKVTVDGFGLTGRVSGSVRIIDEPGTVTSATGELRITDGLYRAFGRRLTIERGKLTFSGGPLENPGLDVRAVRRIDDILAGINVGGTLMEPVISLFSDPPMDQAEALSYLVNGKPLSRTSGEEGNALATAALSMGLNQGESLAKRIGNSFGFEEVTVQTEADVEQSSLVVGKYLTPSVYVRYGVGIFQSFSVFQFEYKINDHLLLQGESGEETGTDLLYTIER